MNYKHESKVTQTHRFSQQEVKTDGGTFIIRASFSRENLLEIAQFKEFELVLEIPFYPRNEE